MADSGEELPAIDVYSRPGCHLCEVLIDDLMPLIRGRLRLQVHNIDLSPDLTRAYGLRIPLLRFRDEDVCQYSLDKSAVQRILNAENR